MRRFPDIEAEDPVLAHAFWENSRRRAPPGGESWNDTRARVDAAIDRLVTEYRGANLVVVAHFGVILTQVQRALRTTANDALAHRIDNLSVTELAMDANGWAVLRINHRP
ncbi:histidine phosphatase family protein [Jhaorihella thermophila]